MRSSRKRELDLRRAWKLVLNAEREVVRHALKVIRQYGFSSRSHLVRHLKRNKIATNNRGRYADRKAKGLCVWCPNKARPKKAHCAACARVNAASVAAFRQARQLKAGTVQVISDKNGSQKQA